MKIEQIEPNKIQITLSKDELDNNEITFHSIMSNSKCAQNLFLEFLDLAEKQIGFNTTNCDVTIETLALNNSDLIFTITRLAKETIDSTRKLTTKRKKIAFNSSYKFNNFDDFYEFYKTIKFSPNFTKSLFYFNNNFYYIYNPNNKNKSNLALLSEFATPCNLPNDLISSFGKQIF